MSKLSSKFLMLALAVLTVVAPEFAHAGGLDTVGGTMCRVFGCIVNGSLLIVIATVAIFFLGIGAFFGKVNWGLVIIIALALVVISGAMAIAGTVLGSAGDEAACTAAAASC